MLSPDVQHWLFIGFWVVVVGASSLILMELCPYFDEESPTIRKAVFMVVGVACAAYFAADFTAYMIMRSTSDVVVAVPPWYGYSNWMREPILLKWRIIGVVPMVRWLPLVIGTCAAGFVQTILFELKVPFRKATAMFAAQWIGTVLVMGVLLVVLRVGLHFFVSQEAAQEVALSKVKEKLQPVQPEATGAQPEGTVDHLQFKGKLEGAEATFKFYRDKAVANLDPYLTEVKEAAEPVTRHLPAGIQSWLENGGWWWTLGAIGILALLWLRRMILYVQRTWKRSRRRKKRRPKLKKVKASLVEDLTGAAETYTDPGPVRILVKGVPARLRMVVIASSGRGGEELTEDSVDWVLDYIMPGLAAAVHPDNPRIRLWPPLYSVDGFASTLSQNIRIPAPKGGRSPWVTMSGPVQVGDQKFLVGLTFHTDEPTSLKQIKVKRDRWLDVLSTRKETAGVYH